jgi:hypothetical protein
MGILGRYTNGSACREARIAFAIEGTNEINRIFICRNVDQKAMNFFRFTWTNFKKFKKN